MASYPRKGYKKAPDNQFYAPDDPIWAMFEENSVTDAATLTPEEAQAKAMSFINQELAEKQALEASQEKAREATSLGAIAMQETETDRILLRAQQDYSDALPIAPLTQATGEEAEKLRNQMIVDGWLKAQEESDRREEMWAYCQRTGTPLPAVSVYQRQGVPDPSLILDEHGKSLVPPGCVGLWASMEDREGKASRQNLDRELSNGARIVTNKDGLPKRSEFGTAMFRTIEKSVELQVAATREKLMREDADPKYLRRVSKQQTGPVVHHDFGTTQEMAGDEIDDLDTFFKKEDEENSKIANTRGNWAITTGREGSSPQDMMHRMMEQVANR
jgi:hypothetical protein